MSIDLDNLEADHEAACIDKSDLFDFYNHTHDLLVAEIRSLRSHLPLSAEERAVLLRIRDYFDDAVFIQWSTTALAVLDRLLGATP